MACDVNKGGGGSSFAATGEFALLRPGATLLPLLLLVRAVAQSPSRKHWRVKLLPSEAPLLASNVVQPCVNSSWSLIPTYHKCTTLNTSESRLCLFGANYNPVREICLRQETEFYTAKVCWPFAVSKRQVIFTFLYLRVGTLHTRYLMRCRRCALPSASKIPRPVLLSAARLVLVWVPSQKKLRYSKASSKGTGVVSSRLHTYNRPDSRGKKSAVSLLLCTQNTQC